MKYAIIKTTDEWNIKELKRKPFEEGDTIFSPDQNTFGKIIKVFDTKENATNFFKTNYSKTEIEEMDYNPFPLISITEYSIQQLDETGEPNEYSDVLDISKMNKEDQKKFNEYLT